MNPKRNPYHRFMEKVQPQENGCWLWIGAKCKGTSKGAFYYGFFQDNYKMHYAHRWIWAHEHGEIPPGLVVMHTCDNPLCVNPAHLRLGTQKDNIRDRDEKGRNGNKGREVTQETRAKMSKSQTGRRRSPEQCEKQSAAITAWWKKRKEAARQ